MRLMDLKSVTGNKAQVQKPLTKIQLRDRFVSYTYALFF